jgi:hypothetical protein
MASLSFARLTVQIRGHDSRILHSTELTATLPSFQKNILSPLHIPHRGIIYTPGGYIKRGDAIARNTETNDAVCGCGMSIEPKHAPHARIVWALMGIMTLVRLLQPESMRR